MTTAFDTIRAARELGSRHPSVKPSVLAVGFYLATFANGNGTNIRPGVARVAKDTGLHPDTVQDAIEWLVAHGELRRDKAGHKGSAACFTWIGGMEKAETKEGSIAPAIEAKQGSIPAIAGVNHPSHLPELPISYAHESPSAPMPNGAKVNEHSVNVGSDQLGNAKGSMGQVGQSTNKNLATSECHMCSTATTHVYREQITCKSCAEKLKVNEYWWDKSPENPANQHDQHDQADQHPETVLEEHHVPVRI